MPSVSEKYLTYIETFEESIKMAFGDDMHQVDKAVYIEHMGGFCFIYKYFPLNYIIEIENELSHFGITIKDSENAQTNLSRIHPYNNMLGEKNICDAVSLLKNVLEDNDFPLYIFKLKKNRIYKKYKGEITLLKDRSELQY